LIMNINRFQIILLISFPIQCSDLNIEKKKKTDA